MEALGASSMADRLRDLFLVADCSQGAESLSAALQLKGFVLGQSTSPVSACLSSRILERCNDRLAAGSRPLVEEITRAAGIPPGHHFSALPKGFSVASALSADPYMRELMRHAGEARQACAKACQALQANHTPQQPPQQPLQQPQQPHQGTNWASAAVHPVGHQQPQQQHQQHQQQQQQRPGGLAAGAGGGAGHHLGAPTAVSSVGGGRSSFRPPLAAMGNQQGPQHDTGGGAGEGALGPGAGGGALQTAAARWRGAVKRPAQAGGKGAEDDEGEEAEAAGRGGAGAGVCGAGAGAKPPGSGFTSAKNQLVVDLAKKGQSYNNMYGSSVPPRTGLARPVKKQALGMAGSAAGGRGAGPAGSIRGYVNPMVAKALEGPSAEGESPFSEHVLALLTKKTGEIPEEVLKLDPKIVEQVCNEVLDNSAAVSWDDIAGQQEAKDLVQEIVVWPMKNPGLFTGARSPPRGLLLFGPPGTGKTLIGKAIASNIEATFFSISASSLTSKWIGEGEKMVKALFTVARCAEPSVIFIDEIDSILTARKSDGEHESSRRLKTEMLVQMEGCDPKSSGARVLIIGATNRPEELDDAARRRLPKQLYVSLPCPLARAQMLYRMLASVSHALSDDEVAKVVDRTRGYSGSDMRNLIQEAFQGPIRDALKTMHNMEALSERDLRPVNLRDFQVAHSAQKASVAEEEVQRYVQYNEKHGAKYSKGDEVAVMEEW